MDTARRQFLKLSGSLMVVLPFQLASAGCSSYSRSDLSAAPDVSGLAQYISRDHANILYLASLAPSGHNTQPWTVLIREPGSWVIGSDSSRWLPGVDPYNRELLLSVGAFLENLIQAARHFGYDVDYKVIAGQPTDAGLLEVRVIRGIADKNVAMDAIRLRRTVRGHYLNREIASDDIRAVFGNLQNVRYVPRSSADAGYLAEGTLAANEHQAWRNAAQEELSHWIRWSDRSAQEHMNGLTPAGMEITGLAGLYVRNFYTEESVMSDGFRKQTVDRVREQVSQGAGWLLIAGDGSGVSSLIETGRYFEQMFLRVRAQGIAIHPMTQMLEEAPWNSEVAGHMGEPLQFILRVGYLDKYPDPVSPRMPLPRFIRTA